MASDGKSRSFHSAFPFCLDLVIIICLESSNGHIMFTWTHRLACWGRQLAAVRAWREACLQASAIWGSVFGDGLGCLEVFCSLRKNLSLG